MTTPKLVRYHANVDLKMGQWIWKFSVIVALALAGCGGSPGQPSAKSRPKSAQTAENLLSLSRRATDNLEDQHHALQALLQLESTTTGFSDRATDIAKVLDESTVVRKNFARWQRDLQRAIDANDQGGMVRAGQQFDKLWSDLEVMESHRDKLLGIKQAKQ